MPQIIKTEFSCPRCRKETGRSTQIQAVDGQIVCPANSAHRWADPQQFGSEGPTMDFKPNLMQSQPQENHGPLTLTVHNNLKAALEQKYGATLSATVSGVLMQLVEGEAMMIPASDVFRIRDFLGMGMPLNSGELVGMIFSKLQDVDSLKIERDQAVANAKAYEGYYPGKIVADLGEHFARAQSLAQEEGIPVKLWLDKYLANAFDNGWI